MDIDLEGVEGYGSRVFFDIEATERLDQPELSRRTVKKKKV